MMPPQSAAATEPGERPKILVIRRDNIGDLVCTTPVYRRVARALSRSVHRRAGEPL